MTALATRIGFRIELWWRARVLPLQLHHRPLDAVVALANAAPAMRYRDLPVAYIVKRVGRTVRRPWLMRDRRCLREGLLAFRFMAAAGHAPELHFGIERTSVKGAQLKAHCWVVNAGETVLNPPTETMVPVYIHRLGKHDPVPPPALAGAALG